MSQFVILEKQRIVNLRRLPPIGRSKRHRVSNMSFPIIPHYSPLFRVVTNKFFNKNLEIGCGSITFATHISRMCLEKTLGMTGFDSV